jgi:DNA polymerase-3 subunit beta
MLLTVERDVLLEALNKTTPIAEKRSPLPILSHILTTGDESGLTFTATDLETGVRIVGNADIEEAGQITLPARKTHEIVKELPAGPVNISTDDQEFRITLVSGKSEFNLGGMDPQDFPVWANLDDVETVKVSPATVLYMLEKTAFASSNDDSRFNLNGVLFEKQQDGIRLVATDGHRLALIDETLPIPLHGEKVLAPKRSLMEMKRLLEGLETDIEMGFEEKNLIIRSDRLTVTMRLIDGNYPDYRKVLPETGDKRIVAERGALIRTLRRAAVLTSDRNRGVQLQVRPHVLECLATHPDLGTARDELAVEYDGDEFELVVNVAYLLEALSVVDAENVSLEYGEEGAPLMVRPEPAQHYFSLVMPMSR